MWCHCLSVVRVKLFDTFLFVSVLRLPLLGSFPHRYLLRRSALELFMVDRSNFFFDFGVLLWKISSPFPLLFACVNNKSILTVSNPCDMPANQPVFDVYFFLFPPFLHFRVVRGGETHIELLFKHVLLIRIIYIWQLRFASCSSWYMCR